MSKHFCSECGLQLNIINKALKNKQIIVKLVEPHMCELTEESEKENITDADKPTSVYIKEREKEKRAMFSINYSDQRKETKTIAPKGVLDKIKGY